MVAWAVHLGHKTGRRLFAFVSLLSPRKHQAPLPKKGWKLVSFGECAWPAIRTTIVSKIVHQRLVASSSAVRQ